MTGHETGLRRVDDWVDEAADDADDCVPSEAKGQVRATIALSYAVIVGAEIIAAGLVKAAEILKPGKSGGGEG